MALGFRQADPLAGFAITALIVHIGVDATRDVLSRLMDVHDEELAREIVAIARRIAGVTSVGDMRVRWLGRQAEVRLVIHVPANMPVSEAHDVAHRVQERCGKNCRTPAKSWSSRHRHTKKVGFG